MGYDVRIDIERKDTGGTFTNYDTVRGTVTLVVTSSISIGYIQVKLEGVSKTEIKIPRERNHKDRRDKDKWIQDVHKVLYDTVLVFPPENVRQVSKAKEFTLTPGNYSYPFEFKIPLNNSCIKLLGITNKMLFNLKRFDFSINNGNFNRGMVKNIATLYVNKAMGAQQGPTPPQQAQQSDYHIVSQLPPSLSGIGDFASVKYFVKVTCKRGLLQPNLRSIDPFIFLPLDVLDNNMNEEYREVFVRKEIVFKNRAPDVAGVKVPSEKQLPPAPNARGFFLRFLDSGSAPMLSRSNPHSYLPDSELIDVPFSFEVRFRHPAFLIPTKKPSFKLFLVSPVNPNNYSLAKYGRPDESSGLGVVYMQRLIVELKSYTTISVLEKDGASTIHRSRHAEDIPIADNAFNNLRFDFSKAQKQKSSSSSSTSRGPRELYEIEIPRKYYENLVLPDRLAPSFSTCNITRLYQLLVAGGFTSEKVIDATNEHEMKQKIRYVDLHCNDIRVLSGIGQSAVNPPSSPHDIKPNLPARPNEAPPLPEKSQLATQQPPEENHLPQYEQSEPSPEQSLAPPLPTYDDVMRQHTSQQNTNGARRQYQQDEQYYANIDT